MSRSSQARPSCSIVDDDSAVLSTIAAILKNIGYSVLQAESGATALALLDNNRSIDLLLTDVVMAPISGPELARRVEQLYPQLPIIFISGYSAPMGLIRPETRKLVEHEAGHCPSGRLIVWDRATGEAIEPKFEPSIGLIEDTAKQVMGPIWVRGGISVVSADGEAYEVRNRMTLCRCGRSSNKPFCDGSHAA